VAYNAELAQVNDRVTELARRLAALDGMAEDAVHPAVREAAASAAAVAAERGQLLLTRAGRELLARVTVDASRAQATTQAEPATAKAVAGTPSSQPSVSGRGSKPADKDKER
jgi:hypothetical protein